MSRIAFRVCASLIVAAIGALAAPASFAQAGPACDRVCLQRVVDKYLDALVAHDPSRAPFAPTAKVTENGQDLGLHEGLWQTADGNSTYRLYFADVPQGQVGFIGVIQEHGLPAIIALRLKVDNNKLITEAETIVSRATAGGFAKPENFIKPNPNLVGVLPPGERVPRAEMIRIANHYFTGLDEEDTGKNVPFDPECARRENGAETANS
ncbi:MAG TPA: hypothetical protein VGO53_10845, partial [Steroidobacteraceae bacterium]|nr:hypothetical protein [Steroidobacteraceae bacterium]